MSLSRIVVQRPVSVLMLFAVLAGIGFGALQGIPIDLLPSVESPVLMVATSYSGAGPSEVERLITEPLERVFSSLGGLDSMSSTSSEGSSRIMLSFSQGTDLGEAANDIRDAIGSVVNRLPDGASTPQLRRFDPNARPIMNIALTGNLSVDQLRGLAVDRLQSALEQVGGVGQASVYGGSDSYVHVVADRSKVESYGFTLTEIAKALSAQNIETSSGSLRQGDLRYLVSTSGTFSSLDDIRDAVVGTLKDSSGRRLSASGPRPVRLSELAEVYLGPAEETRSVTIDGVPGVYLGIVKESGTNSVLVSDAVRKKVAELQPSLPQGVELRVLDDSTESIRASLDEVSQALLSGGALTMLVLLFFLRNIRATLIIGLSIPISLLATLLAMRLGGISLNTVSLSGLILGIGMIVDSSIVVLENIHRKRLGGLPIEDAAIIGADEMIGSITGSALTTICVFAPVLFFKAGLGSFSFLIGDIGFTVIIAIVSSLVTAVLLVPVLSSTYLPLRAAEDRFKVLKFLKPIDDFFERGFGAVQDGYAAALGWVLRHRILVSILVLSTLGASLSFAPRLPFIFSPSSAEDSVTVSVRLRQGTVYGTTLETTRRLAAMIEERVPGIESLVVSVGGSASNSNSGQISVRLPPVGNRTVTPDQVSAYVRSVSSSFPGARISIGSNRGRQLSGTSPIRISVSSLDYDAALAAAQDIESLMRDRFPEIVEPTVNVPELASALRVDVDASRAADLGVNVASVAAELSALMSGASGGVYRSGGNEYDITVELPEAQRDTLPDLERGYVKNSAGTRVPLSAVTRVVRTGSPVSIQREDGMRTVQVTASLADGFEAQDVEPRLRAAVSSGVVLPRDVSLEYTGELSAIQETGSQIGLVLAVAVALVFAVMAGQFESFVSPFIIFSAIPMMLIGAVAIYVIMGQPISMFSLLGLVLLAGIVVNNGIVLVDYTNLLRVRGLGKIEACVEAGRQRLKPILITTVTTIFGMMPLAFFPGEGARITQPVGITVVGGLVSSTLITLFFVPLLYSVFASSRKLRRADPAAAFAKWAAEHFAPESEAALAAGSAGAAAPESKRPAASGREPATGTRPASAADTAAAIGAAATAATAAVDDAEGSAVAGTAGAAVGEGAPDVGVPERRRSSPGPAAEGPDDPGPVAADPGGAASEVAHRQTAPSEDGDDGPGGDRP